MVEIRRLQNEGAGFINDVSNIIAAESWKNPSLVPDLSKDETLFIFSDYSRVQGKYKTYSFLVIGRSDADYFNGIRKILRDDFNLKNRRMSYKGLNDKIKLKALPAFLSCAGAMNGLLMTFAVDTQIRYMFAEEFIDVCPELSDFKKSTLEDMLRVVHFGSQAIMTAFSSGQNIVWFTDSDAIVANEKHEQLFGRLAETTIRHLFMPKEDINQIVFGLSQIDDGSLEIEDFVSIPDLVAGALCETLDRLNQADLRVTSKIILNKPEVQAKTNIICEWIGKTICPLKKFGVVFDKFGSHQWDFRPTFFSIRNPNVTPCEIRCNAQNSAKYISDPIRFDVIN
ncbi:MAG: hypothetical protein AN485_19500 [Anabaena sp. MDT14b]|jgi:hypothetical protein|nr:MAG: hypothetical protein AN485_19500 [Anabaena sp. MDT14b]